ncbi:hypothetical protein GCM10009765_44880 [Fodinicola feengrottensis]|uniref:Uncharacterized protein n=1 Tax=Fodinicola feengrottensis TaxID=435914 RepID=A0ABN2HMR2_9ACTN
MEALASWDRPFGIWHYTLSHSTLLLRSIDPAQSPNRIDVLFTMVSRICLSEFYESLTIHLASTEEKASVLDEDLRSEPRARLYLINGGRDYVVASNCNWHEDEGDQHSPSAFGPLRGNA